MNDLAEFEGTSVCAPVLASLPEKAIRFGGILDEQGTSSGLMLGVHVRVEPASALVENQPRLSSVASLLTELRLMTGFTWEQVARVLDVTARTPYLWTQGNAISRANEEKLRRLLALLRRVDRGSPDANRAALLGARSDGTVPFDLLVMGDFERAEAVLRGQVSVRVPIAEQALRKRRPTSPADRLSLSDEKVHTESGVTRQARSMRIKKGG